jgi:hypothetical protein
MSAINQENSPIFIWPKLVWTITNLGDTYFYLFDRVEGDIAFYHHPDKVNYHVFDSSGLNNKFFLSELEAFNWLERQTLEYILMIQKKKHEAQCRIARPQ